MQDNADIQSATSNFSKTIIRAWTTQVKRLTELFESIGNAELQKEIAPQKNTGVYLLGHLVAVHDAMLPLLGFGKKNYPHLEKPFLADADKSGNEFPAADQLLEYWKQVNNQLLKAFNELSPDQWLEKHEAVSAEDFAKEPHRNKLSVLISRTTHMSYHHGQLVLLKKK